MYHIIHFEISSKKREINCESFNEVKRYNLEALKDIIREGQDLGQFKKDINVTLIPPTIMGAYFHFQMNKTFYAELLGLDTDDKYDHYIKNDLTKHIQKTIKALLTYEE